ncbi:hypothetical protein AKJ16_DCAP11588, partial [Drosera capensis]
MHRSTGVSRSPDEFSVDLSPTANGSSATKAPALDELPLYDPVSEADDDKKHKVSGERAVHLIPILKLADPAERPKFLATKPSPTRCVLIPRRRRRSLPNPPMAPPPSSLSDHETAAAAAAAKMKQKRGPPFLLLVPLIYAPILPLSELNLTPIRVFSFRISLRHKPVLRDRLFTAVLAGAFVHGAYLVVYWFSNVVSWFVLTGFELD